MEIVNMQTSRKDGLKVTVSIAKNNIYFTKMAVEKYGIEHGKRVTFVTDVDRLYFFVNDDPNGLKIFRTSEDGAKICGKALFKSLVRRLPNLLKAGHVFPLKWLNSEIQGNRVVEILFHNKP